MARIQTRPKWAQIVSWIVVAFVALGIIGSATGGSDQSSSPSTSTPTSTSAPTGVSSAPTSTASQPVDTGRMSDGEYQQFTDAVDGVQSETNQFATGAHKCGVIASTGDLAAFSSCMDDAYSGFNDKAVFASSQVQDLEGNVAKQCLIHLRRYSRRLDGLAGVTKLVHDAGANLQVGRFKIYVSAYKLAIKSTTHRSWQLKPHASPSDYVGVFS